MIIIRVIFKGDKIRAYRNHLSANAYRFVFRERKVIAIYSECFATDFIAESSKIPVKLVL